MMHEKKCRLGKRRIPTTEFYIQGKPQIYCRGYLDSMTDEAMRECKACLDWVEGKQCETDFRNKGEEG